MIFLLNRKKKPSGVFDYPFSFIVFAVFNVLGYVPRLLILILKAKLKQGNLFLKIGI